MESCNFGMLGLGVMGQNFALNLERNGSIVAVYERIEGVAQKFVAEQAGKNIHASSSLEDFVHMLTPPRRIMLLIKAGEPIDNTITALLPFLEQNDLIIDGGNSHFKDTERRQKQLTEQKIFYIGMGVSGGEEGALHGPSLMPGGDESAYRQIEPILLKVAAKAKDGSPCIAYIGPGGAGHYVKMIHNGIEYALMQIIAEAYDLIRKTSDFTAQDFHDLFSEWNKGILQSFLIEAASIVFEKKDSQSGKSIIDLILDKAGQKGTGAWTVADAANIGAAIPTINAALDARIISSQKEERVNAAKIIGDHEQKSKYPEKKKFINAVHDAVLFSNICAYGQGMDLLKIASKEYGYNFNLAKVAKIWRAGCIIRSELLETIAESLEKNKTQENILLDERMHEHCRKAENGIRSIIKNAIDFNIPVPALSASLAYYDSYRTAQLPANLIQAERDLFGAHTFERIDKSGIFHEQWS